MFNSFLLELNLLVCRGGVRLQIDADDNIMMIRQETND